MSAPTAQFAVIGAGFWSRCQLAGWQEIEGARCVAICDAVTERARSLAEQVGVRQVPIFADAAQMLSASKRGDIERIDFVDIVTEVDGHAPLAMLAAGHGVHAICQKPLATLLSEAVAMRDASRAAGTKLLVHENWRWQTPLRQLHREIQQDRIGRIFRARIQYSNSFPVFDNQPALKELKRFLLTDIGTHILDVARFLFGEARSLYCQIQQVRGDICGEDVATVMLAMDSGATVTCEMSYASPLEHDRFPETFVLIEGSRGSLQLGPDYWIRSTIDGLTCARRYPPPTYHWVDPLYAVAQSSVVACQQNLLAGLRDRATAETTVDDNLKTLQLVFAAYHSAETGQAVPVGETASGGPVEISEGVK